MKSNATIVVLLASIALATGLQMPPGAPAQAAADERILAAEDIAEVTLEVLPRDLIERDYGCGEGC